MGQAEAKWARYEESRPDQLAARVEREPIVFWPLGLLEHHGWHLPVGLDGIKAERICQRIAANTGGVVLPTMWWGAEGGHGGFMWTLYQPENAAEAILVRTVERLIVFGFRVIVLLGGHYPWQSVMTRHIPALQEQHPEILFLWGTEMDIGGEALRLPGDHAAREETSYALSLHPEFVDMGALTPGRDETAWPRGEIPRMEMDFPGLCLDPGDPCFAQYGEDARQASRERGEEAVTRLVEYLAGRINRHLGRSNPGGV
jgi:creatinine amidohydrolase